MSELWLTRARLRRSGSAAALAPLLTEYGRLDQGHAVVWSLFADAPDRRRDFLWRETESGLFYLLSTRMPVDAHQLFDMDPPKSFSPRLTAGCRLQFFAACESGGAPQHRRSPSRRQRPSGPQRRCGHERDQSFAEG